MRGLHSFCSAKLHEGRSIGRFQRNNNDSQSVTIMNMQKKTLYAAAVLMMIQLAASAQSINVNYQAGVGQRDIFYNGSAVPDGNEVRVGFFTSGFNVAANSANLNALNGAWHQFDTTTIATLFGQPGRFSDSASSFDPAFE